MIALQYSQFGDPLQVVAPVDVPELLPGPGEVRLRLVRSPIHNHDLATIRGIYGVRPELPAIGGSEMLGIVENLGEGVSNVAAGARVACSTRSAWAQIVIASASALVPVPDGIPDDQACQLIAMPLSALVLLDDLHVNAGDWIAQNAANGAVGHVLLREAAHRGVNVVNLVRSEETAEQLRAFGAKYVVVTQGEWLEKVRDITGNAPIVRAIDSVAGPQSLQMQRLLADRGELIVFGGLAADAMRLDPSLMISRQLRVRGFWMTTIMRDPAHSAQVARAMKRLFELAQNGELPLSTAGVYPLADAGRAFAATQTPGRGGKVLFGP